MARDRFFREVTKKPRWWGTWFDVSDCKTSEAGWLDTAKYQARLTKKALAKEGIRLDLRTFTARRLHEWCCPAYGWKAMEVWPRG